MTITTVNPATGSPLETYQEASTADIEQTIAAAHTAFLGWRETPLAERGKRIRQVARLLRERADDYSELMAQEMGKPLKQGRAEIEKCAWVCEYFAENAARYLQPESIKTEKRKSFIVYEPLGVIFSIVPWNFPFWQVFRCAIPTLMAGNAVVVKHAPITTGCGQAIQQLFADTGAPPNLVRSIIIGEAAAAKVIAHPQIAGVALTGSVRAGQAVGELAARALKKTVLELGGSDPYVILEDADLEKAAEICMASRLSNAGQVCIAAKRMIAVKTISEKFKTAVLQQIKHYVMGDPFDDGVNLGPLARADIREQVHRQVQASIKQGATLLCGGEIPAQAGFYYPPTVLSNVREGMPAFDEEIFGPVVALIDARNEAEAIALANDSEFGLGAAVFTRDVARGEKIATYQLQAGACAVNSFVASDPRLPFGGIKKSGHGRELAAAGIHEFVNIKTVSIA